VTEIEIERNLSGGVDLTFRGAGDVLVHEDDTDVTVRLTAGDWPLLRDAVEPESTMSRTDALKAAREHVEAMSTNSRGYQDGVKLDDKVRAVDRFARFLMGESE
jgi:hypothetical protein